MTTRVELECSVCPKNLTFEVPGVTLDEQEYKQIVTQKYKWSFIQKNEKTIGVFCPGCTKKLVKELNDRK